MYNQGCKTGSGSGTWPAGTWPAKLITSDRPRVDDDVDVETASDRHDENDVQVRHYFINIEGGDKHRVMDYICCLTGEHVVKNVETYNRELDVYICPACNQYMEPGCGQSGCVFCRRRPDRPLKFRKLEHGFTAAR